MPKRGNDGTEKDATEIGQADPIAEPPKSQSPQGSYATDYFKANNIAYCDRCGDQFHSDVHGKPICAESLPDCPRLSK